MSLKQLNKTALISLAEKLNLDQEGTKPVIEERLAEYLDNHPELEDDHTFGKFIQFRKRTSPKKVTSSSVPGEILSQTETKLASTPSKLFQIASRFRGVDSSPSKETQEESEEEDDEEEDDDDDVEVLEESEEVTEDKELLDDDETDPEFKPSEFQFVSKIQDFFINKYESTVSFAEDTADDVSAQLAKSSNDAREALSSADSINLIGAFVELTLILYEQVPLIPLRNVKYLDQKILSKYYKLISPNLKVADLSIFLDPRFVYVLLSWLALSVVLPLIGAYYINFIIKKSKQSSIDPFTFNIVKLVLAYAFLSGNVSFNDVKNSSEVWAEEHGLLDKATFFQHLAATTFRNSITLRLILGNLPFIIGSVGGLVALYAAAI